MPEGHNAITGISRELRERHAVWVLCRRLCATTALVASACEGVPWEDTVRTPFTQIATQDMHPERHRI